MKHLSWRYRRRRNRQQQREFCAAQARRVRARWDRIHAALADEPIREERALIRLTVQRVGLDPRPIPLEIRFDGIHSRKCVREGNADWRRRVGRKALVKWFDYVLQTAGV